MKRSLKFGSHSSVSNGSGSSMRLKKRLALVKDALRTELRRRFPNAFYDPARHYMRGAGPKSSPPKSTRDD
jgi:hypothetical protein